MKKVIRKGQYWYVNLSPAVGDEPGGVRKCLVVRKQNNLAQVIPETFQSNKFIYNPFHIRTVDISRFCEKVSKNS